MRGGTKNMRAKWETPRIKVETFAPNDYVSACWGVACNVTAANQYETSIGKYDPTNLFHDANNCGQASNQYIQDKNGDGTIDTMTETGTKGLGNLKCTLYTDGTYTTQESYGSVHPGDYIYWTTSAGSRTWHHQGQAVATETAHPNRS